MVVIVRALGNGDIGTDNGSRFDLWLMNARYCRATGRGRIILAVDNLRQWSRTRKYIKVSDSDSGMVNGMTWRVGEAVYVKKKFTFFFFESLSHFETKKNKVFYCHLNNYLHNLVLLGK